MTRSRHLTRKWQHAAAAAIWQKFYGAEHPKVALALNNLGVLYKQQV